MIHKAKLSFAKGKGTIEVDGNDLSSSARGCTLKLAAGTVPVLTVDLLLWDDVDAEGEAVVLVPDKTGAVLTALGWAPPEADHG